MATLVFVLLVTVVAFTEARWRSKYAELREDWEVEFEPHRFSYRDLFRATNGFRERELLGVGGFGRVYKGTLPNSGAEVAVKRVSHDWVVQNWRGGSILHTVDARLGGEYAREEAEMLLKLGLMCSHPHPEARPSMRLVVQYLEGRASMPGLSPDFLCFTNLSLPHDQGFDDYVISYPSSEPSI